jgi:hypothetical protein
MAKNLRMGRWLTIAKERLLETLCEDPPENQKMLRTSKIGIVIALYV